jgi:hypothetical protein
MKIILYKFIENNKVNIDLTVNKNQDDTMYAEYKRITLSAKMGKGSQNFFMGYYFTKQKGKFAVYCQKQEQWTST